MKKFHWLSLDTGELHTSIFSVFKMILQSKKHYKFWALKWKYSKKGW